MIKTIELPWPPTANQLTAIVKGRRVKTREHRHYVSKVKTCVLLQKVKYFGSARLSVHIKAHEPIPKRRRDIDNLFKAPLDGLSYAGVFDDDSQIDFLSVERANPVEGGLILVALEVL